MHQLGLALRRITGRVVELDQPPVVQPVKIRRNPSRAWMPRMNKNNNLIDPPSSFEELKSLIRTEVQQIEQGKQVDTWAVYTRLSREETQGYSYSLEIQPDRAEAYARDKGATKSRSTATRTKQAGTAAAKNCKS